MNILLFIHSVKIYYKIKACKTNIPQLIIIKLKFNVNKNRILQKIIFTALGTTIIYFFKYQHSQVFNQNMF